ncbi:MAG: polymer-forming cytoskeletal protein [Bacteroidales bacterium]|nr:polymer-forming cytoskeletal protein [Bacteroidales bacterium]
MAKIYNEHEANTINIIGIGTHINGDVKSNSDIRIDGSLTGKLITKGKVVIGESGKVNGEINCKNSDVEGSIEGKIVVAELLSLKTKARIKGDIIAAKLAIEPGCQFSGNCDMNAGGQTHEEAIIQNDKKPKPEINPK